MTEKEAIEQAKDEIKHIRQIIREQAIGWRGVAEPHFTKALALLELPELPTGEFTNSLRKEFAALFAGTSDNIRQSIKNKDLIEACARLDAQQQEIERLKEQKKPPSQERFEQAIVNEYAAKTWEESYKKEVNRLASENKAQAERIEELETALITVRQSARTEARSELWHVADDALAPLRTEK